MRVLLAMLGRPSPGCFIFFGTTSSKLFDRIVLMLYYRSLGKKVVFTAHNVNAGKRDGRDTVVNRLSLKIQYGLSDHVFVHTEKMKKELTAAFGAPEEKVTVIPFGINNTVPNTEELTSGRAKQVLGVSSGQKTMLFFGNIAPYKGLEYLVDAFAAVAKRDANYRLIVAGTVKGCDDYWEKVQEAIGRNGTRARVIERIEYIPDEAVELSSKPRMSSSCPTPMFFKAVFCSLATVLVCPCSRRTLARSGRRLWRERLDSYAGPVTH